MPAFLCNGEKQFWSWAITRLARRAGYHYCVTESVEEVGGALTGLIRNGYGFIGVLGGDGTLQQFITTAFNHDPSLDLTLAVVGGGTMEQLRNWQGTSGLPPQIAWRAIQAYRQGRLVTKKVPLLRVQCADKIRYGFMFLLGPVVRLLESYNRSGRGLHQAVKTAGCGISAALTGHPRSYSSLLDSARALITADGQKVGFTHTYGLLTSTISRAEFGFRPFHPRTDLPEEGKFFTFITNYDPAEIACRLPALHQGRLPENPRLVNRLCRKIQIFTNEESFTIDGEVFSLEKNQEAEDREPIIISSGPSINLVVL